MDVTVKNLNMILKDVRKRIPSVSTTALFIVDSSSQVITNILINSRIPLINQLNNYLQDLRIPQASSRNYRKMIDGLYKKNIWITDGKIFYKEFVKEYFSTIRKIKITKVFELFKDRIDRKFKFFFKDVVNVALIPLHLKGLPFQCFHYFSKRKKKFTEADIELIRTFCLAETYALTSIYQTRLLEQSHLKLDKQNRFNQLRARLWEVASDYSLSEDKLIKGLLVLIGKELKVSRACYNKLIDDKMVCVQEWCVKGIKPSLGASFPRKMIEHLKMTDFHVVTLDTIAGIFPKFIRKAGMILARQFAKTLKLESVTLLPFYIKDKMAGLLTLDVCTGHKPDIEWDEDVKALLFDAVKIITKRIEQNRIEEELDKAYRELELRVQERTKKLRQANLELTFEIDERKKAENEIRMREENLSVTLDSITEGVIVTDAEGMITRMNPAAVRLTGWDIREVRGKRFEKVFTVMHLNDNNRVESPVEKILKKKDKTEDLFYIRLKVKDGTEKFIFQNAAPILDRKGNIQGIVVVFLDVTEKYRMQNALNRADKIDAIGQLAGGIAHDFNNYLSIIIGYMDILKQDLAGHSMEQKYIDQVDTILKTSERVQELTSQLLTFARKGEMQAEKVDMNRVIRETVNYFKDVKKNIKIDLQLNAPRPDVLGDISQLHTAIMNLVMNAKDSMAHDGKLIVSTQNVFFKENECSQFTENLKAGSYLEVCVSDTGCGISSENLDHIFEPFYTTKATGKGTGLGLSVVYGVVKNHNGIIRVFSEINKGTTFKLYFPAIADTDRTEAVRPETADGKIKTGDIHDLSMKRILFIDDEEPIRQMVKEMLMRNGYETLLAEDGSSAIRIFKDEHKKIDLVVLDMVMPGMDGKETFYALKKIDPHIPVLICSGFNLKVLIDDVINKQASGFINKPFRMKELYTKISNILKAKNNENL